MGSPVGFLDGSCWLDRWRSLSDDLLGGGKQKQISFGNDKRGALAPFSGAQGSGLGQDGGVRMPFSRTSTTWAAVALAS